MTKPKKKGRPLPVDPHVAGLRDCIDAYAGRFRELRGARTFADYLVAKEAGADEETLTEPLLADLIERVLGFPKDAYFPQLGKSGLKPDFTPIDLIAHRFVLDAKGSAEDLKRHEGQIRGYIDQRGLDYGVLFNLRTFRVFRRGEAGHDPALSFDLLPIWRHARGEALPVPELEPFSAACELLRHRTMAFAEKVEYVENLPSWSARLAAGEEVAVDVEFLVQKLRLLSRQLAEDAAAQVDRLETDLRYRPGRERLLREELEALVLDLAPGTELSGLPETLSEWRGAEGLAGRAWRQYLVRVAYLALIRMLLYRAWEDVQFVDEYLYDGGFGVAYERMARSAGRVLDEAFRAGAERYRWLFGSDNNYDWYRPRDEALVDVLYSLAPVPLGKLDADVLGSLYESYAEDIDRDRLGQFFTPRSVVRFMLDRAGFQGAGGVFQLEGDERKPRKVLDFATGSGGFLVEAARRVIDEGGLDLEDPRAVMEGLDAIVLGFVGGEISPFPYYLTEVNLLLQVSRLLGRLTLAGRHVPPYVLGALHVDTLLAKSGSDTSLDRLDPEHRKDRAELELSERFGLVPLDPEKAERFRELRADEAFDLVVGNPPYVTEAGNKLLFDRLRAIDAWKGTYRGKTDYLYYFLLLAVEKLAPGGRLCVITPAGWMNAGAADFLRERLASMLRLDELFLFGSYRLFAPEHAGGRVPTPTVESAILVATKTAPRKSHKLRVVALEDEAVAARALSGNADAKSPDRQALLDELARRAKGKVGRKGGIHVLDVPQADLRPDRPWPVKWSATDVAARVVAHLEALLAEGRCEPMEARWKTFLGIQTGADAYSKKIAGALSLEARSRLETLGARIGDPIYSLPPGVQHELPWTESPTALVRSPEPEAVLYGAVDDENYVNLVWLTRSSPPSDHILAVLEPWRALLAERAEFKRNPRRRWWETCWPRDLRDLTAPKVIALHRTDRGRFALDEQGRWSPSGRMSIVVGREAESPVAYLCGLLNSELLDLWYSLRGRTPWHVRRDYEPLPMGRIPYRRPDGDPRADRVAALVRELAANRRALLPHRVLFPELGRVVKDPWKTGPVALDRAGLVAQLPPAETISVRLDPALELVVDAIPLGKPLRPGPDVLVFQRSRKETARVSGDPVRLDLLEHLLGGRAPADLPGFLLPRDLAGFEGLATDRSAEVEGLLAEGRRLVEEVERLVCALYDVPDDLTEAVVEHAVHRAGSPGRG